MPELLQIVGLQWNHLIAFVGVLPSVLVIGIILTVLILTLAGKRQRKRIYKQILQLRADKKLRIANKAHRWEWAICLICWCALMIILLGVLKIPVFDILKFLGFLVFYAFLPGYWIVRNVKKIRASSVIICLSALVSLALLVFVYIVGSCLGTLVPVYFVNPASSVISLVFLWKNRNNREGFCAFDVRLAAITSVALLFSVSVRSCYAASPYLTGYVSFFMDSLYIISNSAALTGGLFAESLNFPGFQIRYHVITNILQACAIRVTNISAVDIFMVFWPFLYLTLTVVAVHALFVTYRASVEKACTSVVLTFTSEIFTLSVFHLMDSYHINQKLYMGTGNLEAYLFVLPNGIDIAIPALVGLAIVILKIYHGECSFRLGILLTLVFTALTTGAKATFGVCVCATLFITVVLAILQARGRKRVYRAIWLFLASAVGFVTIYLVMIYNPSPTSGSSTSLFNLMDPRSSLNFEATHNWLMDAINAVFPSWATNHEAFVMALLLPISLLFLLPFSMPAFLTWSVNKLRSFKNISMSEMFLAGVAICGIGGYYCVNFDGYSQVYFWLAAVCFVQLIGITWVMGHYKGMRFWQKSFFAIALACSIFFPVTDAVQRISGCSNTFGSIILREVRGETVEIPAPSDDALTAYEYEGMLWLRENTDKDVLVATDRFFNAPLNGRTEMQAIDNALYFYYAAYSERHLFLSGFSYSPRTEAMEGWLNNQLNILHKIYDPKTENRAKLMQDNGISYIVVSKYVSNDLEFYDEDLTLVFQNRDISIYQSALPC